MLVVRNPVTLSGIRPDAGQHHADGGEAGAAKQYTAQPAILARLAGDRLAASRRSENGQADGEVQAGRGTDDPPGGHDVAIGTDRGQV